MSPIQLPDYGGGSLVNLVAELEYRLTGASPSETLHPDIAKLIPSGKTYVLLLLDGLGSGQLSHVDAAPFAAARVADLDAPFPTTTTVSLATIATGLPASRHGLLGYQLYLPEADGVVYTIKWARPWGETVELDHAAFLPSPNLWERLTAAGVEPITVQPGNYADTPLSQVLFRGCRFEPAYTIDEMILATEQLAAVPNRLILAYLPHVDIAAHVYGQESDEYADALDFVAEVWTRLEQRLAEHVVLVGTADHGHVDYPQSAAARIDGLHEKDYTFYGDSRVTFVRGDGAALARELPARWLPLDVVADWWGPGPRHPQFTSRAPDGVLIAEEGHIVLHRHSDKRMIGRHGGLSDAERLIPLMLGTRAG